MRTQKYDPTKTIWKGVETGAIAAIGYIITTLASMPSEEKTGTIAAIIIGGRMLLNWLKHNGKRR